MQPINWSCVIMVKERITSLSLSLIISQWLCPDTITFLVDNLLILSFFYAVDLMSYCLINLNLPKSTCRSLTKKTRWSSLKTSKCTYKNWALGNSFHKSGILIEACMVGYRCQYLSKETPPSICLPCKLPWFTLRAYVIIVYYMFADYQLSNRAKNRERSFHAM